MTLDCADFHSHVNDEVLTNRAHDWSECLRELPVDLVVQHVKKNDGLIANTYIAEAHQLDEQLFDEIQRILVSSNLRDKQRPLNFLKVARFLVREALRLSCKLLNVLVVKLLSKWVLFDVDNNLLECLRQSTQALHKHVLVARFIVPKFDELVGSDYLRLR